MTFSEQAKLQFETRKSAAKPAERGFREKAWAEFERQGLPGKNNEAWKYSSLVALSKSVWQEAPESAEIPEAAARLIREWRSQFDIAVMVNGVLNKRATVVSLESGYEFTALAGADAPPQLTYDDGFVSLAAAVYRGGFNLDVAPGIRFPKPLLIVHIVQGEGAWSSTLNRIALGARAEMQVAEVYIGGAQAYLRTDITKADLSEGAILNWTRAQLESGQASHFSEVQVGLARDAQLSITQINGGAGWARSTLKADIAGEGAEAHINGLSFGRDHRHIDQRVQVNHLVGNTSSSQLFKGVLKDFARGILNGKIYIAQNAQKVNSSQLNHNLLLSPTAEADTKPELEIYADDVKANHGASIGKMDEEKLFYLLSRAIPRKEAVQMLAHAFVADVLMKILSPALREMLSQEVETLLPEFLNQMETVK